MSVHHGGRGPGHISRWTAAAGASYPAMSSVRALVEADGGDVDIVFIGDSIGNETSEYVYLFAQALAEDHPTHTVNYALSNDGTASYPAPTQIAAGSGTHAINIWNASISGTRPVYLMGSKLGPAIVDTSPDLVVWCHGQNVYTAGLTSAHFQGEFFACFDQVRSALPGVPTAIILQNPRRDDNNMVDVIAAERAVSPFYGDVIDVYSEFIAQGKAGVLYADNVHPSSQGSAIYRDKTLAAWRSNGSVPVVAAAQTDTKVANLLTNGDFSDWSGATPANWTAASVTATKDTVIKEGASSYSCKLTGTTAGALMRQDVSGAAHAGKDVFLVIRQYVTAGQADTTGRAYLRYTAGGVDTTISTRAGTYGTDGFCWQMIGPVSLPANTTSIRVALYCNTSANADSAVNYDRAVLTQSSQPRDMT